MNYSFSIREDLCCNENGESYIAYGIDAINAQGEILQSFQDVFFDKQKAIEFVSSCNAAELDLIHLSDVVEDALTEQYAISY